MRGRGTEGTGPEGWNRNEVLLVLLFLGRLNLNERERY